MTIAERFDKFVEDYDLVGIDPVPEEAQTLIRGIFSSICIRRVHLSDFVIPQRYEDYITIAKELEYALQKLTLNERLICIKPINDFFQEIIETEIVFPWWESDVDGCPKGVWGKGRNNRILSPKEVLDDTEKKMQLLKLCHGGKFNDCTAARGQLAEILGVSTRTVNKLLRELTDSEFSIHGVKLWIDDLAYGANVYSNTIHPVFLALNMVELAFLTVTMQVIVRNSPEGYATIAANIANNIYSQLSSYAKKEIDAMATSDGVVFQPESRFCTEEERGYDDVAPLALFDKGMEWGNKFIIKYEIAPGVHKLLNGKLGRFVGGYTRCFVSESGEEIELDARRIILAKVENSGNA